jgi:site-specific DNA-methyltransferase (adenine-specific)
MEKLTWRAEVRKVKDLKNWEKNPRKITNEAFEKLKDRINKRGMHDVLKLDTDENVLSGNQRQRALTALDIEEVNVLIPSRPLTDKEKKEIILESNLNDGIWDFDMLGNEFEMETLQEVAFPEMSIFNAEGGEDEQGKLDEFKEKEEITCPECGHQWRK